MADILLGNVRGPIGPEGQTGATGETGQAATIEIGSVSTTAYGNPAQVVNSGTEEAAILDFTIPQGKPGEQTTRMGALTLDTITAQTATFPVPAVGETGSTVFGKIIKFFTDTVSALASKLNVSDVINNLTSTATDKPLSANMGRQLNSKLTLEVISVNSSVWKVEVNTNYTFFIKIGMVVYFQIFIPNQLSRGSTIIAESLPETLRTRNNAQYWAVGAMSNGGASTRAVISGTRINMIANEDVSSCFVSGTYITAS